MQRTTSALHPVHCALHCALCTSAQRQLHPSIPWMQPRAAPCLTECTLSQSGAAERSFLLVVREPSPPQTVARPSPGEAESVNSSLWDFCGNQLSAARLVIAHALQSAKCDLQNHIPLCMGIKCITLGLWLRGAHSWFRKGASRYTAFNPPQRWSSFTHRCLVQICP